VLRIYHKRGSVCATLKLGLTWFHLHRRVWLTYQSRIESCQGRFIALKHQVKRPLTQSFSKPQWKCGVEKPATIIKATYFALRPIAVTFPAESAAWNLRLRSPQSRTREVHSRLDGISKRRPEFSNEPTQRLERIMPPFRCQSSLMGNHNSLTGLVQ
jgi:hypothetical protein